MTFMPTTTQLIPTWYKSSPLWPIPEDWEILELWKIADIYQPQTISQEDLKDEWYNVYWANWIIWKYDKFNHEKWQTIITCRWSTCWTVSKTNDKSWITWNAMVFNIDDTKENINKMFFYYVLSSQNFKSCITWSGQPQITRNPFSKFKIIIPKSLPEQTAIAAILSTTDTVIQQTQEIIRKLETRNKGLGQKLLYNKKWDWMPIKSFSKEVSQKNKNDEDLTVLSCTKHHWLVPSLEYFGKRIFSNDLTTYKIVPKKCFAYATNHIEEWSIWYQDQYENALISPMYTVFQTNEIINDYFLFKILKSHKYIHEYQKRMEWSIDRRGGLRRDEFAKIKVPVPSMEEQEKVMLILDKSTQQLNQYKQKLAKLQTLKKWLMQQLLTWKVRVKIK